MRYFVAVVATVALLWGTDKAAFVHALQKQPPLSYAQLCQMRLGLRLLDASRNEIEKEYCIRYGELHAAAVDFSRVKAADVVMLTDRYGVVYRSNGDEAYGIVADTKGNVLSVVLLAFRTGMRWWRIERTSKIAAKRKELFEVADRFFTVEPSAPHGGGEVRMRAQTIYSVKLDKEGRFTAQPIDKTVPR